MKTYGVWNGNEYFLMVYLRIIPLEKQVLSGNLSISPRMLNRFGLVSVS
jgi:hypothetical protein